MTSAQLCLSSGMSVSQDNLLDYEEGEAQGEDLLDQSVNSGRDSLEDVVVEYERVLRAPSPRKGCDEEDLFEDDGITHSQLLHYTNAPTQEDNPEGPDQSPEVVEIPPSEPMDRIEPKQNSASLRDGQDKRTLFPLLHLWKKSLQVRETPRRLSKGPSSQS